MKTLKDYSIPIGSIDILKNPETVICKLKTLKQSGIEDIISYQKEIKKAEFCDSFNQVPSGNGQRAIIGYIKEKFNITEEDINDYCRKCKK